MFLNLLNTTEKSNFMKLAMAVIKADGIIEDSEKHILSEYANEMQINICNIEEQVDTEKIIKEYAMNSTAQTKRIVFIELLALAFADGNYAIEEKTLIQQLANAFDIDRTFIEKAINLEEAYMTAYMSLMNMVEKGE